MERVILLGAEGISEAKGVPWLRDPTAEELEGFKSDFERWLRETWAGDTPPKYEDYTVDGTGRPYWPKVVTGEAPDFAREKAGSCWRAVRL